MWAILRKNHLWTCGCVHTVIKKTNPPINISYGVIQHDGVRATDFITNSSLRRSINFLQHRKPLQCQLVPFMDTKEMRKSK